MTDESNLCKYQYCYLMRDDAPCTNMRAETICKAKAIEEAKNERGKE